MRKIWVPFDLSASVAAAANVSIGGDLLTQFSVAAGLEVTPGMTVLRIRGTWSIGGGAIASTFQDPVRMAIAVSPPGGWAVVPIQQTSGFQPMWREDTFYPRAIDEIAAGTFANRLVTGTLDTKAMRKLSRGVGELRYFVFNGAAVSLSFAATGVILVGIE